MHAVRGTLSTLSRDDGHGSENAKRLIDATCRKQGIGPHQLTMHADRGAPMRSKILVEWYADLHIGVGHSRPRVSNDSPFSEAQFRTV